MIKAKEIISILLFLNVLLSIYLIYEEAKNQGVCIIGDTCNAVQSTSYGKILGIALPWIGLLSFVLLLLLYFIRHKHPNLKKLYLFGAIFGGIYALYLISVQLFVLKQLCPICMIIDPSMLIIAILSLKEYLNNLN